MRGVLRGSEISDRWEMIREGLKLSALPTADTSDEKLNNIFRALLSGRAACYMTQGGRGPKTMVILTVSVEEISGTRNLLIYCAHGFVKENGAEYIRILEDIRDIAKDKKCDNIIAYVGDDKLKGLLKAYGAECNYTLAVFPLIEKFNVGEGVNYG